ncbi:hypothetical protein CYLTODRAFT_421487 [Cylindrobasidium torrendii FP15055 ss-10]|uniref:Uncharacterized protein n=1 Tax=Cylindrobasidium torrendii FP15055 ss-10 TaxID=1314674 RepID=A0A0D7BDC8_9AGAR|nr:hypothetical protein CYLTODRAFT_421487 [Cylindrobasidium torrendii FP15055 ss-10]
MSITSSPVLEKLHLIAKSIIQKATFAVPPYAVDHRKLLESMLDFAPSSEGKRWMAVAIHHAADENALQDLAQRILETLLFPCMLTRTFWDAQTHIWGWVY